MIDLDYAKRHLKTSIVSLPTYQFRELIEAIEEAKEIIENLKETTRTYAMQTYSKIAHKNADIADEWLSKYFEQSLNEDQVEVERLSHENE